ncbi:hypothetical protein CDAR_237251 [Caerostris darwini]|uniref:Uncharacterized protein n=1 Tax=Caerostris darwini TaxID=1538125 RepID=A0AAV4R6B6_9ARAC|nr:hypothetical protein CDAR_237251 [Caerostris darwini]
MAFSTTFAGAVCLQAIFCAIKFAFQDDTVSLLLVVLYVLMVAPIKPPRSLRKPVKVLTVSRKGGVTKKVPIVYSKNVWMFCEALGVKAKLASSVDNTVKNVTDEKRVVPTVKCKEIFMFCEALGIKAKLA